MNLKIMLTLLIFSVLLIGAVKELFELLGSSYLTGVF
jgi:hypothetical protein